MTDPYSDGVPFSTAKLNSNHRGHENQGVLDGGDATPGSGSWDVDVSEVDYLLDGVLNASSTTLAHDDSPLDRLDLITVDANGTISITKGSEASSTGQPDAPDIPTDEVLIATVHIRDGASEIVAGDIDNSAKTLLDVVQYRSQTLLWSEGFAPEFGG